jgi:hypothetical protein
LTSWIDTYRLRAEASFRRLDALLRSDTRTATKETR